VAEVLREAADHFPALRCSCRAKGYHAWPGLIMIDDRL
jgi:hypothetical protein